MKKAIRRLTINTLAIALLTLVLPGVSYGSSLSILFLTALIFSLANFLIRPILKIILLPINLITFGLAGWLIQVIILYLTTLLVEGFSISAYHLGPFEAFGVQIPQIYFSGFWSYFGSSLILSFISNLLYWLL